MFHRHRTAVAVLLLALVVRVGILLATPGALTADTDGYRRLAENLVRHGTYGERADAPTAFRPPLYPLSLTACVATGPSCRMAIGVWHVLLGVATVWLVLLLGRWWQLPRGGATAAALLVACDPILLASSSQIMTETLATFLVVVGLVALTWMSRRRTAWRAFVAGVVIALGSLCRPTLLVWAAAVVGIMLLGSLLRRRLGATAGLSSSAATTSRQGTAGQASSGTLRANLLPAGAFILGLIVILTPWTIRNERQFSKPIASTTHGGYTLLLGNNPEFYQWLRDGRWGSVWWSDRFDAEWNRRKPAGEVAADATAYREAWQTIDREPRTFLYSCLVREGRFWSPLPHQVTAEESGPRRLSRYAVAAWYAVEFLLAAVGVVLLRTKRKPPQGTWLWGVLLVLSLMAVHGLYWTDMRMRAPATPIIALAAAIGLAGVGGQKDLRGIAPRDRPGHLSTSDNRQHTARGMG